MPVNVRSHSGDDACSLDPRDKIGGHDLPHDQIDAPHANRTRIKNDLAGTGGQRGEIDDFGGGLGPFERIDIGIDRIDSRQSVIRLVATGPASAADNFTAIGMKNLARKVRAFVAG